MQTDKTTQALEAAAKNLAMAKSLVEDLGSGEPQPLERVRALARLVVAAQRLVQESWVDPSEMASQSDEDAEADALSALERAGEEGAAWRREDWQYISPEVVCDMEDDA